MIFDTDSFISLRKGAPDATETAADPKQSGQPTRVPTAMIQGPYVGVDATEAAAEDATE